MGSVNFRKAKLSEIGEALLLIREYFNFDGITWNRQIRIGLKLLVKNSKIGQFTFIYSNGFLAGYFVFTYGFDLEFGGKQVTVTDFYIRTKFRRLGLGRLTIRYLSKLCKAKKIKVIELQVERHNKKAQIFYKKMGFKAHDRIPLSKRI